MCDLTFRLDIDPAGRGRGGGIDPFADSDG